MIKTWEEGRCWGWLDDVQARTSWVTQESGDTWWIIIAFWLRWHRRFQRFFYFLKATKWESWCPNEDIYDIYIYIQLYYNIRYIFTTSLYNLYICMVFTDHRSRIVLLGIVKPWDSMFHQSQTILWTRERNFVWQFDNPFGLRPWWTSWQDFSDQLQKSLEKSLQQKPSLLDKPVDPRNAVF